MTENTAFIPQSELKHFVDYFPETGEFVSRINRIRVREGILLGWEHHSGYMYFTIDGVTHNSHQWAFLYMTGKIPSEIDHINQIRNDNRWLNLRAVTRIENMRNKKLQANNTSGFCGIHKVGKKWVVRIGAGSKQVGRFNTEVEAIHARQQAEEERNYSPLHGAVKSGLKKIGRKFPPKVGLA